MVEEPFSRWPRKSIGVACKTGNPPPPLSRFVFTASNRGGCEQPVNGIRRHRRFAAILPLFSAAITVPRSRESALRMQSLRWISRDPPRAAGSPSLGYWKTTWLAGHGDACDECQLAPFDPPDICGCDIDDSAGDNGDSSRDRIDRCPGSEVPQCAPLYSEGFPPFPSGACVCRVAVVDRGEDLV
jgi:hypothetical protein